MCLLPTCGLVEQGHTNTRLNQDISRHRERDGKGLPLRIRAREGRFGNQPKREVGYGGKTDTGTKGIQQIQAGIGECLERLEMECG